MATPEFQQRQADLDLMQTKILDLEAEADRLKAEAQALRSKLGNGHFKVRQDADAAFVAQHGPAFPRQDFVFDVYHDLDHELRQIKASAGCGRFHRCKRRWHCSGRQRPPMCIRPDPREPRRGRLE